MAGGQGRKDSVGSDDGDGGDKKLQNQFSFVERATQTMNNAMKVNNRIDFAAHIVRSTNSVFPFSVRTSKRSRRPGPTLRTPSTRWGNYSCSCCRDNEPHSLNGTKRVFCTRIKILFNKSSV